MKILRLLYEKYFSLTSQEFLVKHSRLGILNMLKCIELFGLDNGKWINHWVNKVTNCALLLQRKEGNSQSIYSILDLQFNRNPISSVERDKLISEASGDSSIDILLGCILKDFLTVGENKETGQEANYGHLYKNKYKLDKLRKNCCNSYPIFMKYVALCLSGQLTPESWWVERGEIPKIQVNYNLKTNYSNDEIKSIISACVLNYCGESQYFNWESIS